MYKFAPEEAKFHISRGDDGVYVVTGAHIEKIFHQTDFNREASVMRFARQLRHAVVDQALRDLGVQDGDLVRILNFEFEFKVSINFTSWKITLFVLFNKENVYTLNSLLLS